MIRIPGQCAGGCNQLPHLIGYCSSRWWSSAALDAAVRLASCLELRTKALLKC